MLIEWVDNGDSGIEGYANDEWWYWIVSTEYPYGLLVWESKQAEWVTCHKGTQKECKQVAEMYEATGARSD